MRLPQLKRSILLLLSIAALALTPACGDDDSPTGPGEEGNCRRVGAVCNDGTHSDATGSGACSHHGGVDHWLYADCD